MIANKTIFVETGQKGTGDTLAQSDTLARCENLARCDTLALSVTLARCHFSTE